jgi:hypothetical protein
MYYRHTQDGRNEWQILSAKIMSYIFEKESDGFFLDMS